MDREYYEQPSVWASDLTEDPAFRGKMDLFAELIPSSVETILDVGCGNGAITNVLGKRWQVTGLDFSGTALKQVETSAVQGSCCSLPFCNDAFDLVLTSELIEHLDAKALALASAEIARVSRRYVLVSVPFEEQLDSRLVRCEKCQRTYHVYHHLHSFSEERLKAVFPTADVISTHPSGNYVDPDWPKSILRLRQGVLGVYWRREGRHQPMCPHCGDALSDTPDSPVRFLGRAVTRLCYRMCTLWKPRKPRWLVMLFDLTGDTRHGGAIHE